MPAAAVVFTLFLVDTIISWNDTTHSALVVSRTGPVYHVCRVTVILAVVEGSDVQVWDQRLSSVFDLLFDLSLFSNPNTNLNRNP